MDLVALEFELVQWPAKRVCQDPPPSGTDMVFINFSRMVSTSRACWKILSRFWDEAFMELATDCVYVSAAWKCVYQQLVFTSDCLLGVADQ